MKPAGVGNLLGFLEGVAQVRSGDPRAREPKSGKLRRRSESHLGNEPQRAPRTPSMTESGRRWRTGGEGLPRPPVMIGPTRRLEERCRTIRFRSAGRPAGSPNSEPPMTEHTLVLSRPRTLVGFAAKKWAACGRVLGEDRPSIDKPGGFLRLEAVQDRFVGAVVMKAVAEKRVGVTYDAASQAATLSRYANLAGTQVVARLTPSARRNATRPV